MERGSGGEGAPIELDRRLSDLFLSVFSFFRGLKIDLFLGGPQKRKNSKNDARSGPK